MAVAAHVSSGETSLEELDQYLRSDHTPPPCMQLSQLDGFLTGIIVGPERIMPSEWLPVVWGEGELAPSDDGKVQAIVDAVLDWHARIVAEIRAVRVDPVFLYDIRGDMVTSEWAEGFGQAMALRPRRWEELAKSPVGMELLLPIMLLRSDASINSDLMPGLAPAEQLEAVKEAAESLPMAILTLATFWQMYPKSGRVEPRSRLSKVGRNDLCPCGSGKKFKKCCLELLIW